MLNGMWLVARWDLKQRLRSRKLLIAWIVLTVVLTGLAGLLVWNFRNQASATDQLASWTIEAGPAIFGFTVLLILTFSLVVVPAFAASAIVGERESSTLATLQVTSLRPSQIAGGKLIASCVLAAAFVAAGIPALGIAVGIGHISVWRALICLLVVFAEMAIVCAVALGWSAVAARALVSTVLTYLTTFVLCLVSLLIFGFIGSLMTTQAVDKTWDVSHAQVAQYGTQLDDYYERHPDSDGSRPPAPSLDQCGWQTAAYPRTHTHYERVWWMLLVNPYAIVSDAAPLPREAKGDLQRYTDANFDPLAIIAVLVRSARAGDPAVYNNCFVGTTDVWVETASKGNYYQVTQNPDGSFSVIRPNRTGEQPRDTAVAVRPPSPVEPSRITMNTPLWPVGLAVHLLIAAGFFWLAVRRVAVPYGKLPKGQRVA